MPGAHDRFEIVSSLPREKGRYFESFRLPCQRALEDFPRGNRDLRRGHEVPRRFQLELLQALADAFAKRVSPEEKERYISAELRAELHQRGAAEMQLPQPVER